MKLTLHTEGWYDAAHHLEEYEGKCQKNHGHTYKVKVWVQGDSSLLDKAGILWDFGKLKSLLATYDHQDLNEIYNKEFEINSTAENQCKRIYEILKAKDKHLDFKVRVYEQLAPKESYCECGDF